MVVEPTSTAIPHARSVNPGNTAVTVGAAPSYRWRSATVAARGAPANAACRSASTVGLHVIDDQVVLPVAARHGAGSTTLAPSAGGSST